LIFWFFCIKACPDYFGGKRTKKNKGSKEMKAEELVNIITEYEKVDYSILDQVPSAKRRNR